MKILIVDDDKEIVELLSIYVKNEGYEPIQAFTGKEALTKIATNPGIDLMILDIMMPNMSGIEVIKAVRRIHKCRFWWFLPKQRIWIKSKALSQVRMIMCLNHSIRLK
mgnify:CR=1 FL=1